MRLIKVSFAVLVAFVLFYFLLLFNVFVLWVSENTVWDVNSEWSSGLFSPVYLIKFYGAYLPFFLIASTGGYLLFLIAFMAIRRRQKTIRFGAIAYLSIVLLAVTPFVCWIYLQYSEPSDMRYFIAFGVSQIIASILIGAAMAKLWRALFVHK